MRKLLTLLFMLLFVGTGSVMATVVTSISNLTEWKSFVSSVNAGDDYSSTTVTLTANIIMETSGFDAQTVGTSSNPFTGTFDGGGYTLTYNFTSLKSLQYCAPFRYIKSATIKNLKIAGEMNVTDNNYLAGIVGYVGGTSTTDVSYIDNCTSSMSLTNSASDGDGRIGGIVGYQLANSGLQITNCLVEGTITGRGQAAGVMGYKKSGASLTLSSVFLSSTIDGKVNTFVKSEGGEQTISACYTTIASPDQGTYVGSEELASGEVAYNLQGSQATQYWGQDLNNASSTPMLTSDAAYKVFNAGDKYTNWTNTINNDADWVTFSKLVANGYADMNVTMTADVTVSDGTMIGTSSKPYEGTFDGKGHTLTFTYNNESSDGIAPFQCINNATINDLFTSGSITARNVFGGIVGTAGGNSTLNRCSSNMKLIAKHGSDTNNGRVAGLVGRCADNASPTGTSITLNYCQYTGSINSDQGNRACGLVAWLRNGTLNAKNCFINPSSVTNGAENCSATGGTSPTTNITSCYYTKQFGSSTQGSAATLDQLESGALAYTLNSENEGILFFGQAKLNTSVASTVPELTSDESKKVIKITFSHNGSLKQYANKGGVLPSPTPTSIKALSYYDASKGPDSNPYFSLNEDKQVNRNYKRFPLTISSAGATTLVLPVNVSTLPDGVKAYNLKYTSGDKVTAKEVTSITANKPVLINAEPGNYVLVSENSSEITYDTEKAHQNGALYGVYTDTYKYVPANSYVLQNGDKGRGFYKVAAENTIKITSFRAYLTAQTGGARSLSIVFEDEGTTGVNEVRGQKEDVKDIYYDLSGRRIAQPTKGLYIVNGKKVIIK